MQCYRVAPLNTERTLWTLILSVRVTLSSNCLRPLHGCLQARVFPQIRVAVLNTRLTLPLSNPRDRPRYEYIRDELLAFVAEILCSFKRARRHFEGTVLKL